MSNSWWEKVLQTIGFEEIEVEPETEAVPQLEQEQLEEAYGGAYSTRTSRRRSQWTAASATDGRRPATEPEASRKGSLVSLPAAGGRFRLIVVHPTRFDEVQYIANHLKDRRPVILNLEGVEKEDAQRLVNFLSGAIYALDGEMQRIGSNMLLFTPINVEVDVDDVREELEDQV